MCFSHENHNLMMYPALIKIINESIYDVVGLELVGGKVLPIKHETHSTLVQELTKTEIVKHVLLVDDAGTIFSVEPDVKGLEFAKGQISFDEYKRDQKKSTKLAFGLFGASITLLFGAGFLLVKMVLT